MPKIPYATIDEIDPRLHPFYYGKAPLNILWMMGHAPNHADAAIRMSDAVLRRGKLDSVLRQIALIRMCEVIGTTYEKTLMIDIAQSLGMDESLINAALEGSKSEHLDEMQKMACRLAEELVVDCRPSEPVFEYMKQHLSPREFVELVMGIGFYLAQSRLIETFGIEVEEPRIKIPLELPKHEFIDSWRRGGI